MSANMDWEIRNICIYGVGGVGGYFGGKIAHAVAGRTNDAKRVFFIARGKHLEEIKTRGLILNTSEQEGIECMPFLATNSVDDMPVPDICLLCVKSYDLPEAARALSKKISNRTIIIPLLNGVDIYDRVRYALDDGIVLPACAYVGTHIEKPGTVTQKGAEGIILCGRDPENPAFDPEQVINFFSEMNIRFTWFDDPSPAIWEKYIFIAAFGLITAYSGKTLGEVISDESLKGLVKQVMEEIVSIAEKKGVMLPANIIPISLGKANRFPYETKTSYQRDVEVAGKQNEGDLFGATIIRMGKATGVPTAATESVWLKMEHGGN